MLSPRNDLTFARLASGLILICVLVVTEGVSCTIARARSPKPNVLFIAVDDLKPVLGCYGDPTAITPSIDEIAKQGTVFVNAHCQWPVCGGSRASLMTGLRPEAVGVMDLKTNMRAKDPNVLTLAQHFKNHGYSSAGTGKIYDPRCVDNKRSLDTLSWSVPFVSPSHSSIQYGDVKQVVLAPEIADGELTDGQIAANGIELMRQLSRSEKPFFLAVGFKKPHLPFVAPKKYWDLYDRDQFQFASHRGGIKNDSSYTLHDNPELRGYEGVPKAGPISTELQQELIHGYYACVSFIDAQVGRLLDELRRLGLFENTTIILWGDHGFHLGDHSLWGKHTTLEHATRVPLIVRPRHGSVTKRSNAPVELDDMFPTLCELAGLPVPDSINGRSLLPIIRGSDESVRDGAMTVFKSKGALGYSYRTQRYRYTLWLNRAGKNVASELYDYQIDPQETQNLAEDPRYDEIISKLGQHMKADAQGCERLMSSNSNQK
ncbi:sulfatase [Neorhodopirellula pilleata]|uniref:Arylsulfatase n=1 Tax=Neorhodopirellula pilleata TaxID=2714738 RepID=A0A5C6AV36_9BACT|nr:sulfatase [Neorhodopirellula pilleata]TWU03347.1 Arylsulfatase [Neorhodopirellula pilleata]